MGFRYDITVFQEGLKHEPLYSLMDELRLAHLYKQFFQTCNFLEVAQENFLRHLSVKSVYFFMITLSGAVTRGNNIQPALVFNALLTGFLNFFSSIFPAEAIESTENGSWQLLNA